MAPSALSVTVILLAACGKYFKEIPHMVTRYPTYGHTISHIRSHDILHTVTLYSTYGHTISHIRSHDILHMVMQWYVLRMSVLANN